MNYLDIGIIAFLLISGVIGMYQGFIVAAMSLLSFLISWISAATFYPVLSRHLASNNHLLAGINDFVHTAARPDAIYRTGSVTELTTSKLPDILNTTELPAPLLALLEKNIAAETFNFLNPSNIGDYFTITISNIILNIISFIVIFVCVKIIFGIVISIIKNITRLPVLKQFDCLVGFAFGMVGGFLLLFILFALMPLGLTIAPIEVVSEMVEQSSIAKFFYDSNIVMSLVKGII